LRNEAERGNTTCPVEAGTGGSTFADGGRRGAAALAHLVVDKGGEGWPMHPTVDGCRKGSGRSASRRRREVSLHGVSPTSSLMARR
jgi:hypothetical protein